MSSPESLMPTIQGSSIPSPDSYDRYLKILMKLYSGRDVIISGQENIPKDEPLLVVGTHRGLGDIPAMSQALNPAGRVQYVAKDALRKVPIFGKKMFEDWGAIPIKDGRPTTPLLLQCLSTFHHEQDPLLGIFPEATRKRASVETVGDVPSFIGRIASYANVRVLPVGIWGTQKYPHLIGFSNLFVQIDNPLGPFPISGGYKITMSGNNIDLQASKVDPLAPSDKATIREAQHQIHQALQICLDDAIEMSLGK